MTKAVLKKKLHEVIDKLDDQGVLELIHSIAESHLVEDDLTVEQKKELALALKESLDGKTETYSWEEVKAAILAGGKKKKS